ncbi:MAG: hypothetical protein OEZ35_04295 [Candidatus Bathyarchaeota archaeon]|nr:hypothetical protein [Candidatus Bathyarchaeota archaeon]
MTIQQQYRVGVLKNVVKLGHSDSDELERLAVVFIHGNPCGHLENDIIAWFLPQLLYALLSNLI